MKIAPPNCTTQVLPIKCNINYWTDLTHSFSTHDDEFTNCLQACLPLMRRYSAPCPMPGHHQDVCIHQFVLCVFQYILALARFFCLFTPHLHSAAILEDKKISEPTGPWFFWLATRWHYYQLAIQPLFVGTNKSISTHTLYLELNPYSPHSASNIEFQSFSHQKTINMKIWTT